MNKHIYLVEDGKWDETLFRLAFLKEIKAIEFFETKYRSYVSQNTRSNMCLRCSDDGYWAVLNKVAVRRT